MSSAQISRLAATIRLAEPQPTAAASATTATSTTNSPPLPAPASTTNNTTNIDEQPLLLPTADPAVCPAPNGSTCAGHKRPHPPPSCGTPDEAARHRPAKKPRPSAASVANRRKLFIYGNYDRYYGYRNPGSTATTAATILGCAPDFADCRLEAFRSHAAYFEAADVLDIGCNRGNVALAVAQHLGARSVVGLDIDKGLVAQARQHLAAEKRRLAVVAATSKRYPHNAYFVCGNYVLADETLLSLERPQFDTILCLSVSKWIHLNFGDAGLRLAFRRMFAQLRGGGRLVLEAQEWSSYKRRKKLTPEIERHYGEIRMRPLQFAEYLCSEEVGFVEAAPIEAPRQNAARGFRRPIWVFEKPFEVVAEVRKADEAKAEEFAAKDESIISQ